MWGFWDKVANLLKSLSHYRHIFQSHWRPNGALVNGDGFTINAAGQAYLDLYHKEWNSTATLQQLQPMQFTSRVFHGDYQLNLVSKGNIIAQKEVSVVKGADTKITLSP